MKTDNELNFLATLQTPSVKFKINEDFDDYCAASQLCLSKPLKFDFTKISPQFSQCSCTPTVKLEFI
jgi:hypothetical protein